MREALDKVAFLPFGLLVDQWRWKVFSGEIPPAQYNAAWWELREKYQGIAAPVARTEPIFDPGAKYHVPANTPYTRYFLAHILQFQFHRALCEAAGHEGPLHRCSIYGNRRPARGCSTMLEMGASRPWPEALEALTGEREMDATAILDYFAPLQDVARGRGANAGRRGVKRERRKGGKETGTQKGRRQKARASEGGRRSCPPPTSPFHPVAPRVESLGERAPGPHVRLSA